MTPHLLAIIGPTSGGKTDLSLTLAREFDGEIVNCDSVQLYTGVDIGAGTAPGKFEERNGEQVYVSEGVPHHLINYLSPSEELTVSEFKKLADERIREIAGRGKLPMLVGGSMLFSSAVIDNYQMPEVPPDINFRAECAMRQPVELLAELEVKDPAYAKRAGKNPRYVVRALEVMRATGKTMTELQKKGEPNFDVLTLGVTRPREELYARINRRFDQMVNSGLVEETQKLGERYGWDAPVFSSLGHRQIAQHLRGEFDLPTAIELAKKLTREYAKRQLTWFRRDDRIHWVTSVQEARRLVGDWLK